MDFKKLKSLALVGTAVVGIGLLSQSTPSIGAATNVATMNAKLATTSTITAVAGAHVDFKTWLIGVPVAAPASTLVLNPNTGVVVKTPGAGVQLIQLSGTPNVGIITVSLPAGAVGLSLQMTEGVVTNTLGAGLALTSVSYYNPQTPAETGVLTPGTPVPVTFGAASVSVPLQFGATITATATPAQGLHTNIVNMVFAF